MRRALSKRTLTMREPVRDSLAYGLHPVEPCTYLPCAINPDLAAGWAAQGLGENFFSAAWHSM
jgi:hypothetical protein